MLNTKKNILFVLEKIGPYHNSRLNYLTKNKDYNIIVIETNPISKTYLWEEIKNSNYEIYKLRQNQKIHGLIPSIKKQINEIFLKTNPNIIFLTGWFENSHHFIIYKSYFKKIPLIILSDSRYNDHRRFFYKEFIKRLLLKNFSSALVAGKESSDYLLNLNFKKKDIFKPFDVVDNNYFLKNRNKKQIFYSNYFLCISRFIKKKNLINLIKAFEIYKKRKGNLNLLIIGAGPEEFKIKQIRNKSEFADSIFIESWKETNLLPEYYKKAKATVLASLYDQWGLVINESMASGTPCIVSKNCGCYLDLIEEGLTGWGFDPNNIKELANLFFKVESLNQKELDKMKKNVISKINQYGLDSFADAVNKSIKNAIINKRFSYISSIFSYILFILRNKRFCK